MSTAEAEATEQTDELGETSGMSERAARAVLATVLLLAIWGIVAALPETAYVVIGVCGTLAWQRARRWLAHRRDGEPGEDTADPADDGAGESVAETLHRLAAPHVFLAEFADARGLSKEAGRAVLEALSIPVRRAVRNGDHTGVGVHKDDLPPLPRPLSAPPVGGVDQGQPTNQHGVRVERTNGGLIIYDLADTHRHHRVASH